MSQDESSVAGTGQDEDDGSELPPESAREATGATGFEDLLGNALLRDLGVGPAVDEDAGTDADEDEEATDALEGDEPDGSEETEEDGTAEQPVAKTVKAPPGEQLAQWVDQLADNPKSINSIPLRHHPAALEALATRNNAVQVAAVQAAREYGQQEGRQNFERELNDRIFTAQVGEMKENDKEGYVAWRDMNREQARRYDELTAPPPPPGAQDAARLAAQSFNEATADLRKQIQDSPAVLARMNARLAANPTLYTPSAQGMREFIAHAGIELAAEATKAAAAKEKPAADALAARRKAQEDRNRTPRPNVSPGRGADQQLTDDVDELLGTGLAQAMRNPAMAVR